MFSKKSEEFGKRLSKLKNYNLTPKIIDKILDEKHNMTGLARAYVVEVTLEEFQPSKFEQDKNVPGFSLRKTVATGYGKTVQDAQDSAVEQALDLMGL